VYLWVSVPTCASELRQAEFTTCWFTCWFTYRTDSQHDVGLVQVRGLRQKQHGLTANRYDSERKVRPNHTIDESRLLCHRQQGCAASLPHPRQPFFPSGNPCADIHSCPQAHWYRAKDFRPEKSDLGTHHPGPTHTKINNVGPSLLCYSGRFARTNRTRNVCIGPLTGSA
jgi:hypothetical protein